MENSEVSNILIVESDNDKYFMENLATFLKATIKVSEAICGIDDFKCLDGLSEEKLRLSIDEIKFDDYDKIGIMIDADKHGIADRIDLINKVLKTFDDTLEFTDINQIITSEQHNIEFICFIMNVGGFGELETLLRAIKSADSTYADCLDSWETCLKSKGKEISAKEFDKFWVSIYHRYDSCSKKEQKQAKRKCDNQESFKKSIYNFDNPLLEDLKKFISLLVN